MFPKPGRSSPSRANLNNNISIDSNNNNNNNSNSPSKFSGPHNFSAGSIRADRSPTGAQSPSTIHSSPGRRYRGTTELNAPSNSSPMKEATAYHSHRSANSSHNYYHHGSSHHHHHHHCRENMGHTGNDSVNSHSAHGSFINPTHTHAYNTNYHNYTSNVYNHSGNHLSPYRSNNPAYHLRDFMLNQWRQFESLLSCPATPHSTPVKTVSLNGSPSFDQPGRSAAQPPTPSGTPASTVHPSGQVTTDRTTLTGIVSVQPPETTSDHTGSLPRRHPVPTTPENVHCLSSTENIHILTGTGYRNKMHGTARGVLGSPLIRHGSSEMNTWQRGQATVRKNSSPSVFGNRGPSNLSNPRGMSANTHITAATTTPALVSVNAATTASTTISTNNNSSSICIPAQPSNPTVQTTTATTAATNSNFGTNRDNTNNNNNNNNNNATGSPNTAGDSPVGSSPPRRVESPLSAAGLLPAKQTHAMASSTCVRPQTAESVVGRKTRHVNVSETESKRMPIPFTERVASALSVDILNTETKVETADANTVLTSSCKSVQKNIRSDQDDHCPLSTDCSIAHTVKSGSLERMRKLSVTPELPRSPVSSALYPAPSEPTLISDTGISVEPSLANPIQLICPEASSNTPITSAMSVNVTLTPPSNLSVSNDRADTPTANGEQYWTPDPPASPSSGTILMTGSSPPTTVINKPVYTSSVPCDFSDSPTPSPDQDPSVRSPAVATNADYPDEDEDDDDEAVNVVCRVGSTGRPRLESLNDVD